MLVMPISINIAENRYILIILGAPCQLLCSHTAAMILPISRADPMQITAAIDPGKIVASPIILKYAAIQEILKAEIKVDIAKIIL